MKRNKLLTGILLTFMMTACVLMSVIPAYKPSAETRDYITVDSAARMQAMDGWGTSLGWWANAAGSWDVLGASGLEKREEIANLAFSPDGLNLNIARYNVGAGDNASHTHMVDNRKIPVFKESRDAAYDWTQDAAQLYFLTKAQEIRENASGVNDMINEVFANSPPYWMTKSGCGSGGVTSYQENLDLSAYGEYITYFSDVLEFLTEQKNVPVHYAEPMNEPASDYWQANGSQEGNKVLPGYNQSKMYEMLNSELAARGLTNIALSGTDETNPSLSYDSFTKLSAEAKAAIEKINYHTYSRTRGLKELGDLAYGARRNFIDTNYKLWMSEICYGSEVHNHDDSMNLAYILAGDVYDDLYTSNASAWIIWQLIESELSNLAYGNNYGLIHGVYQDHGNKEYGFDMEAMDLYRGDYYISRQYYALGQYSKYIKPGYFITKNDGDEFKTVSAVSSDGKESVVVLLNNSQNARTIDIKLSNFNAASVREIRTDNKQAWNETNRSLSGGYYSAELGAGSILTLVFTGETEGTDSEFVYLKSASATTAGLTAEYFVKDKDASYRLLIAGSTANLPINGGTEYSAYTLNAAQDFFSAADTFTAGDEYFAVIEMTMFADKYYSDTRSFAVEPMYESEFTYITLAGKKSITNDVDEKLKLGANYSVFDKPFGLDPLTNKKWGYVSSDAMPYYSDNVGTHLRYSDTSGSIIYKYQVEEDTDYALYLGFYDAWDKNYREFDIYINNIKVDDTIDHIRTFTARLFEDVRGQTLVSNGANGELTGECYITVELRRRNVNTEMPLISIISIQEEDAENIIIKGSRQTDIVYNVGGTVDGTAEKTAATLAEMLPDEIELIGTNSVVKTSDFYFKPVDYSRLQVPNNTVLIEGYANEYNLGFTQVVSVQSVYATSEMFYYYDCGNSVSTLGDFQKVKSLNPSLKNSSPDETTLMTTVKGRYGSYDTYWRDDKDIYYSVIEGKSTESYNGASRPKIDYIFTGLPAGDYRIDLGLFDNWNANRPIDVLANGAKIGNYNTHNRGQIIESFRYTLDSAGTLRLKLMATTDEKPLLSFVYVTKIIDISLSKPIKPRVLTPNILKDTQTVEVADVKEGYVTALLDRNGGWLADRLITAENEAANLITFENLSLGGITELKAVNYYQGIASDESITEAPRVKFSAPRTFWSAAPDVITIEGFASSGITGLLYQAPGSDKWNNIKAYKYFRAEKNGEYKVKLVTKAGTEVIETVEVTHVDVIGVNITEDAAHKVNRDVKVYIEGSGMANSISKVTALDGGAEYDITAQTENGKYYYTVSKNKQIGFTVTTTQGNSKTFYYNVGSIDKTPVSFGVSCVYNSTAFINFEKQAGHQTEIFVTVNGATSQIFADGYSLAAYGKYDFKFVSETGLEIVKTIHFSAAGSRLSGNVLEATEGAYVKRMDGGGGIVPVINGKATFSENGVYYEIAGENDAEMYISEINLDYFRLSAPAAERNGWVVAVAVSTGLALGTGVFFGMVLLKKKGVLKF